MAYTAWSVVYGEQPTAAKWNQLGQNDAGFKDGTNIDDDAILNRHMAALSVEQSNINFASFNWENNRTGIVNTAAAGGFAFTALNGGLSLTVPMIAGAKYEITISATYVAPTANTQCDIQARIGSTVIIDTIATNGNANAIGLPHSGRKIYTAASTGNVTIDCGVVAGSATNVRTDAYTVTCRRIA